MTTHPRPTLLSKILCQPDPALFHTSENISLPPEQSSTEPELHIQYLGTAGFILSNAQRTIVLDPFLSRPTLWQTLTQPLRSNAALIRKYIPHADEVLIGHAHYDHILDAPEICHQTGARLIGSTAAMMVGRAAGLPEHQLQCTAGDEDISCGHWTVRGLPSLHGKALVGRVPLPGDMTTPPPWPPRFYQLKHGQVLNWLVDTGRLRVVHIDSAEFLEHALQGIRADIVCLCAIGRQYRPHYLADVVRLLQPKVIIPCHWDTMCTPLEAPPDLLPNVRLARFVQQIREAGVEPVVLPLLGTATF